MGQAEKLLFFGEASALTYSLISGFHGVWYTSFEVRIFESRLGLYATAIGHPVRFFLSLLAVEEV